MSWQPGERSLLYAERVERFPPAGDDRAVPPAAPADRRPTSTASSSTPSKLGWKYRSGDCLVHHRAVRHEEGPRDPARSRTASTSATARTTPSRLRIRSALARRRTAAACAPPAPTRATNTRSRAPSKAARPSSMATTSTPRRATCTTLGVEARLGDRNGASALDGNLRRQLFPRCREHGYLPGHTGRQAARQLATPVDRICALTLRVDNLFDRPTRTAQTSPSATTVISRRAGARCSCPSTSSATERHHRGLCSSTSSPA